jgi:hypothetical protein
MTKTILVQRDQCVTNATEVFNNFVDRNLFRNIAPAFVWYAKEFVIV